MSNLRSVEIGAVQQALVVGQVTNSLTNEAISSALNVEVAVRYPGDTQFQAFPAKVRIMPAGYFSIAGSPTRVLPLQLAPADTVEFRLNVSAPGFTLLEDIVSVSAASATPSVTTEVLASHNVEVALIAAPLLQRSLALDPLPVGLTGVVIEDNDQSRPLSGVSIQVIAPEIGSAVTSDVRGRYRIENLPIAQSITLQMALDGDLTTTEHIIDYTIPLNTRTISLNG